LKSLISRVLWNMKKNIPGVDRRRIKSYLAKNEVRKVHVGCGANILNGWLNLDYWSRWKIYSYVQPVSVSHIDATGAFPFKNDEIDYVFSEHMIEHITFPQGMNMLAECYRILKPGGKLRISTPDLSFLIDLYKSEKSEIQKSYIKWSTDTFIKEAPCCEEVFVINNFVRDWGHHFIYDERLLRYSLERSGFAEITKCKLRESDHDELRNLENESRMPKGFLSLESLTLEATKI